MDLDGIDPAFAPGVSHHEPGGLSTRQVIELIQNLDAEIVGADIVELHTGRYCDLMLENKSREGEQELNRLRNGARHAADLGLEVHAGHGLTFNTVKAVAAFPEVVELNIGHFLVGEGIFVGLDRAVAQMRAVMADARGMSLQPVPAVAR